MGIFNVAFIHEEKALIYSYPSYENLMNYFENMILW